MHRHPKKAVEENQVGLFFSLTSGMNRGRGEPVLLATEQTWGLGLCSPVIAS